MKNNRLLKFDQPLLKSFFNPSALVLFFFSAIFLFSVNHVAAAPPYQVMGYCFSTAKASTSSLTGSGGAINWSTDIPWQDLTVVLDAFMVPNTNNTFSNGGAKNATLVNAAHTAGERCIVSLGGSGQDNAFTTVCQPANRAAFASAVTALMMQYGYDGADIDWEQNTSQQADATAMMQLLYTDIKALPNSTVDNKPRTLSFATVDYISNIYNMTTLGSCTDWCFYMGYDWYDCPNLYNGPLNLIKNGITALTGGSQWSYPISKMILGCPLYTNDYTAGCGATEYNVLSVLHLGTAGAYNGTYAEQVYTANGHTVYVDTAQSFCDKINWAIGAGLKGIGMWDVGQALPSTDSAVTGIWNTIGGAGACLTVVGPTATFTKTPTPSPTKTVTPTFTVTSTASATASRTPTGTSTQTGTFTATRTSTSSPTNTPAAFTSTPSSTASRTPTNTSTGTSTPTRTVTATASSTPTNTVAPPTSTPTKTATPSSTPSNTVVPSTSTSTKTATPTASSTPSNTAVPPTSTPTSTASPTATVSATSSSTPTQSATPTLTGTYTPSPTGTLAPTSTLTHTGTPTFTGTSTFTVSGTPSATPSATLTKTATPSSTTTSTASDTPTLSATSTFSKTPTPTPSATGTFSSTPSGTPTSTSTVSATRTFTFSSTPTFTATSSHTPTGTPTPTLTLTFTPSHTPSFTPTFTFSTTPTFSSTPTITSSPTPIATPNGTPVVYPNPWNGTDPLKLHVVLLGSGTVKVKLFTPAFRKVWQGDFEGLPAGNNELILNLPRVANGIYYLIVEAPGTRWIIKLLVVE